MQRKIKRLFLIFLCFYFSVFADEKDDIDFANGLYERGYYKLAIEEYKKFIENYPKSIYLADAYFRGAKSNYNLKKYEEAKRFFKKFLEIEPETKRSEHAVLMYALCFKYLGEDKESYKILKEFIKKFPRSDLLDAVYYVMADLEEKFLDYSSAAKHYGMAYVLGGKESVEALYEKGFALIKAKKYEEAVSVYEELCKKFPERKDIYLDSLFKLGKLYFSLGREKKSLKCFEKILRIGEEKALKQKSFIMALKCLLKIGPIEKMEKLIEENKGIMNNDLKCEALSILALACNSNKNYDKVIMNCDYVLQNGNREKEYYKLCVFLKLNSLYKKKEYEKFLLFKSKADNLNLKEEYLKKILYMEGYVREKIGQYELAQKAYFNFIRLSKGEINKIVVSAYINRAECFSKLGEYERAHNVLSDLIKKCPDLEFLEYAYIKDAEYLNNLGRIEDAVAELEQFVRKYPKSKYAKNAIFAIVSETMKLEQYGKMERYLKKCLELFPDERQVKAKALYWLGWNELRKSNYEQARKYYEKIYNNFKGTKFYWESLYWLGVISLQKKKYDNAYKYFVEIIKNKNCKMFSKDILVWFIDSALKKRMFEIAFNANEYLKKKSVSKDDIERAKYYEILCLNGLGKYEQAVKRSLQFIRDSILSNYEEDVMFALADSYIGLKKYDNALKVLDEIYNKAEEDINILLKIDRKRAEIEEKKGDYKSAAKKYLRIAILYDSNYCPEAAYKAYMLFKKIGDIDSARRCRKEIFSRWPNSKQAELLRND